MDFLAVGEKIKELRTQLGLLQKDLAAGICTQAQISKIEKGVVFPYAPTLYLISQRLGVDVNYFFDIGTTPRLDYILEVSAQLKSARRSLNYEAIKEIIKSEEKNPLFTQNRKNLQLLLWHKGICEYHLNHNIAGAFTLLEEAISLTHSKVWSEREIEILVSKGIVLFEEGKLEEALAIYQTARENLEQLPYVQDETVKSRLLYNIARVLTRLKRYDLSTSICKEAIDWCLSRDNLYLLGELHYHIGYNFEIQENFSDAKKYMEQSLVIFDLQQDEKYLSFIKNKIAQW